MGTVAFVVLMSAEVVIAANKSGLIVLLLEPIRILMGWVMPA